MFLVMLKRLHSNHQQNHRGKIQSIRSTNFKNHQRLSFSEKMCTLQLLWRIINMTALLLTVHISPPWTVQFKDHIIRLHNINNELLGVLTHLFLTFGKCHEWKKKKKKVKHYLIILVSFLISLQFKKFYSTCENLNIMIDQYKNNHIWYILPNLLMIYQTQPDIIKYLVILIDLKEDLPLIMA